MNTPPFHLAFPVTDLDAARVFYTVTLGCAVGRESEHWIDFNFFGHQITCHLCIRMPEVACNQVDGKQVPSSHFGAILPWETWHELAERLTKGDREFLIEPYLRFPGEAGEQATMFISDPSGNGLEFKSFKDESRIFAK